jgi:hypothetical protein
MSPLKVTLLSTATILVGAASLLAAERTDQTCTLVEFSVTHACPGGDMTEWCSREVGGTRGCPAVATNGACTPIEGGAVIRCDFAAP